MTGLLFGRITHSSTPADLGGGRQGFDRPKLREQADALDVIARDEQITSAMPCRR